MESIHPVLMLALLTSMWVSGFLIGYVNRGRDDRSRKIEADGMKRGVLVERK